MEANGNSIVGTGTYKSLNTENEGTWRDIHEKSTNIGDAMMITNFRDNYKETADCRPENELSGKMNECSSNTPSKPYRRKFFSHPENVKLEHLPQKYGYVFRPKSFMETVFLSGTVCGIEFCYSAETAFVTPILLGLGLQMRYVTMIWCLSPLIGFILTPIFGSMSDSCESRFGRRRPFILLYSAGILMGLLLVPKGHAIGLALGDQPTVYHPPVLKTPRNHSVSAYNQTEVQIINWNNTNIHLANSSKYDHDVSASSKAIDYSASYPSEDITISGGITNSSFLESVRRKRAVLDHASDDELAHDVDESDDELAYDVDESDDKLAYDVDESNELIEVSSEIHIQTWSIVFTVIGVMLLDFCCDACQSPSRTYLLDVSMPEDHAAGLSSFTLMAGFGGSIGFLMGAIPWEQTGLGRALGGQINTVFLIVTIVFIFCLISTLCSFPEIPLPILRQPKMFAEYQSKLLAGSQADAHEMVIIEKAPPTDGTTMESEDTKNELDIGNSRKKESKTSIDAGTIRKSSLGIVMPRSDSVDLSHMIKQPSQHPSLLDFIKSIFLMPRSLKILCLTNLFCWMSLVSYTLYFSDYVAECVFEGDPIAPEGSPKHTLYKEGILFACYGMALFSMSCAVYSYFVELIVKKIGTKPTYIGGQLVYCVGMILMAVTRHKISVIVLSPTAGVMYSTLFTIPYLLIANYHSTNTFTSEQKDENEKVRGIGTDVATISSMVFVSQLILSLCMGSIVEAVGSKVASICAASVLSFCGAITATQVLYLDK